jgi:hypothetical protein
MTVFQTPADWDPLGERLLRHSSRCREVVRQVLGADGARVDDVSGHAGAGDLSRELAGESRQPCLCGYVCDAVAQLRSVGDHRPDVDDPPPAACQHSRQEGAAELEGDGEVEVYLLRPLTGRAVHGRGRAQEASGVVDEDVSSSGERA